MDTSTFVPDDFQVPPALSTERFRLEPLRRRHNVADHRAWTASIDHIKSTPGFAGRDWPDQPVSLQENAAYLAEHEADFSARVGFTYTVLDPVTSEVIGCVYIYPPRQAGYDVDVSSWVVAERAELDAPLHDVVRQWLAEDWPFTAPEYADRPSPAGSSSPT
jgi:hypothetical protein